MESYWQYVLEYTRVSENLLQLQPQFGDEIVILMSNRNSILFSEKLVANSADERAGGGGARKRKRKRGEAVRVL